MLRPGLVLCALVVLVTSCLVAPGWANASTKPLPALAPAANDSLSRALAARTISQAEYALERAASLFRLASVRSRYPGTVAAHGRDATLILRDLAARRSRLSAADRRRADRILARPTDGAADPIGQGYTTASVSSCGPHVCMHWVETTEDAPPAADANVNGIPDRVETALAVFEHVWQDETGRLGYRAPLSDTGSPTDGGSGKLDVYLAEIGDDGLYGYCTTDDPRSDPASGYAYYDVSAYCVVDNDFSPAEFPGVSGVAALRVTAAHEFFHAVQFAYDWLDDAWLMEGTATWIEDEVYDGIDDNLAFLWNASTVSAPDTPVDWGRRGFEYGAWIYWRFLSEYFGPGRSSDPSIVRTVWRYADGSPAGPDYYSLQAARAAVRRRGASFRAVFARFGAANRAASTWYREGSSYPSLPAAGDYVLSPGRPATGRRGGELYHLTSRAYSVRPGTGVPTDARLRVSVDLPRLTTGPGATLVVHLSSGGVLMRPVSLDRAGDGARVVRFGADVRRVDVVLTNGSRRYDCWWDTAFSCGGLPVDDALSYSFRAELA